MNRPTWLSPPLTLFIATLALYAITAGFDFQIGWDDDIYVLENATISFLSLQNIHDAFTGYYGGNYAPVQIISYMVDYALWGLNPAGYHLMNVLIHALNGVLLYQLLRRAFNLPEFDAFAAAAIFLFHPVQVETVAWISQRKSLLAIGFFLSALICYAAYHRTGKRWPYLLAIGSMAAAVLSKSVAVVFPLMTILYDLTTPVQQPRSRTKLIMDKVPFILVSVAAGLMAIDSQSLDYGGGRRQFHGGSPFATFVTMIPVLTAYLQDCIWPFGLSPSYDIMIREKPDPMVLASLIVILLVAWGGYLLYRHKRELFFWYAFFFVCLLPVLQIVPLITLKNDRYLYLPLIGFAVLLAVAIQKTLQFLTDHRIAWGRYPIIGMLLLLPILSFRQTLFWRNDLTLWNHAMDVDPGDNLAASQLIKSYLRHGDKQQALSVSRRYQETFYRRQKHSGNYDSR